MAQKEDLNLSDLLYCHLLFPKKWELSRSMWVLSAFNLKITVIRGISKEPSHLLCPCKMILL